MPGVIKGGFGGYVYQNSFDDKPVMKTVYGKRKTEQKPAGSAEKEAAGSEKNKSPEELSGASIEEKLIAGSITAEEARLEREQLQAEYEAMRSRYESEAERFVMRAKDKATEIYEQTKLLAEKTIGDARAEAEKIKKNAAEESARQAEEIKKSAFEEANKAGYEEGYVKALKKCKDSLLELKEMAEQVTDAKGEILMKYERQLFDTIFEIVQKVTMNALGQKDKGVITRMIREAGKKYKASKNIKITLSKLDISDEAQIDEELLSQVFKNSENVEIQLLDDAPSGTLMIDDGSEITDASIQTQLKMVEQLGKGKYRDTSITDMLASAGGAKKKPAAAKKRPSGEGSEQGGEQSSDDESGVPDVVYASGKAAVQQAGGTQEGT